MPARNSIKEYSENSYYHIYNRGVEKRRIFQDERDHGVFLGYLKNYLTSKEKDDLMKKLTDTSLSYREKEKIIRLLRLNNFQNEISLLAYCLMPNHFHFLVKQRNINSIHKFMQSLCTRYTMYFNRKHKRVGPLFQSVYKAVRVDSEDQLVCLNGYIHRQALATKGLSLRSWDGYWKGHPSSLLDYLGKRNTEWVKPATILSYFSKTNKTLSYESFILQEDELEIIKNLIIEL